MSFKNFNLDELILKAIDYVGYDEPTPIQEQAIPILLNHKDLLACAQTGTGKTAAFALPIIQSLCLNPAPANRSRQIKALILAPTRELAAQIAASFNSYARYTPIRTGVVFGGVPQGPQETALIKGVDVLVATPGRLLDLMRQGYIYLGNIEWFVLDEADLMLDMGFIPDIRRVITELPAKRQTVFLSATIPPEAMRLASKILHNPERIDVTQELSSADEIKQELYFVKATDKRYLLADMLRRDKRGNALVFTRTKQAADRVARALNQSGIPAEALHGDKSQVTRIKALGDFKSGRLRVMVATDIAARGIDVTDLTMVINYELPNAPEMYVHRIGRTGRAGAVGKAVSFCDSSEKAYLREINRILERPIPVILEHPFAINDKPAPDARPVRKTKVAQESESDKAPIKLILKRKETLSTNSQSLPVESPIE